MFAFLVPPQSTRIFETSLADDAGLFVLVVAGKRRDLEVVGPNMSLERLVFAKCLIARWEVSTPETLLALVYCLMSA